MKRVVLMLLVCSLGAYSAFGQAITLTSTNVNLNTAANNTLFTSSSSTILGSIGCMVTVPPNGAPTAVLKITTNGGSTTASYSLYSAANVWPDSLFPFITWTPRRNPSEISPPSLGNLGGDSFLINFANLSAPASLKVEIDVTTAGSNGTLQCNVMHS